jgi:acetyl-CoA carboxylase biotin carboxyl carrier protein
LDIKFIKQVVELVKRADLSEFTLEEGETRLHLSRTLTAPPVQPVPVHHAQGLPPAAPAAETEVAPAAEAPDPGKTIASPMVGTFYAAPSPDSAAFVQPGDSISEDTVVCILEAMKVMNEIKAETKGVIAEILVENGESVEYGQPLFRLK